MNQDQVDIGILSRRSTRKRTNQQHAKHVLISLETLNYLRQHRAMKAGRQLYPSHHGYPFTCDSAKSTDDSLPYSYVLSVSELLYGVDDPLRNARTALQADNLGALFLLAFSWRLCAFA